MHAPTLTPSSVVAKATGFLPEVQIFDSSRFESVLALAKRLEGEPLDILVANAGIVQPEYRVTDDGWEETYAKLSLRASVSSHIPHLRSVCRSTISQLRCSPSFCSPIFFEALNFTSPNLA